MKRWIRRIAIAAVALGVLGGLLFEVVTHVGRGWLFNEPFYEGRPASFWAGEIEHWETQDPDWRNQSYVRRPMSPRWLERFVPESKWPGLLDGDPAGLTVLHALAKHPSREVQDWARIGIERLDNLERGPFKIKHPDVILAAELFEVDEAFYMQVANSKWQSLAEFDEWDRDFLDAAGLKPPRETLFDSLGKQKMLMSVKDLKIADGKEDLLLGSTKEITYTPNPLQLCKGPKQANRIDEGMTLRAAVQITDDRRFVRIGVIEKISKLEGMDKISWVVDRRAETFEVPAVKESVFRTPRTIPDGGSLLLPLQYRPADAKEKGRWWVVRITPRIYIEEEERAIREMQK